MTKIVEFFFIHYERMRMRRENSKIKKIREIDFRLTLKELVVTKNYKARLEGKYVRHEITEI